jgi:hypothetical protein
LLNNDTWVDVAIANGCCRQRLGDMQVLKILALKMNQWGTLSLEEE